MAEFPRTALPLTAMGSAAPQRASVLFHAAAKADVRLIVWSAAQGPKVCRLFAGGASHERTRLGNKSIPEAFWTVKSQFWHGKSHKSQCWLSMGRTEDGF